MTKPLRDAYDNREEIVGKAKDLPMAVLQSALSGVGHALLIGDRVRTAVQRLAGSDREKEAPQPAAPEEDKPTRRAPVIFAPRPSESNGSPEPTPTPEPVTEPAAETKPEPVTEPVAETKPKPKRRAKPETKPETKPEAEVAPEAAAKVQDKVQDEPQVAAVELDAEPKTAAPMAEPEIVAPAGKTAPAEPIPGYGDLTIASLRARMRGKSTEDLQQLIAYEEATTARSEVITMFRNRVTKLESGV
ncbi:hypothetical protein [Acrocarpospora phusangensis]|uniref:hypothetical protein n=1 Tax=Acrocarpospora phusangensis TaxID=1070424 RepID=UPI0019514A9C|nr:hypothetical protein [Acrocarpospora phusangensis]